MSLLPWIPVVTLVGALLALVAGARSAAAARAVALLTALFGAVAAAVAAARFAPSNELVTLVDVPWITQLGIRYHLAVDGISLSLVVLTALAATSGVLFSWTVADRVGEFFALYLTLVAGVYGVFLSADAFLFFVFYEIAIVPKYFLVAGWGSNKAEQVDVLGNPKSIFEKLRMLIRALPDCLRPSAVDGIDLKQHTCRNPDNGAVIDGEIGKNIGRGGRSRREFSSKWSR
jgi:hypothetical protein